ncbi:hypothetical protein, partial [Mycoplasmoides pirum]
ITYTVTKEGIEISNSTSPKEISGFLKIDNFKNDFIKQINELISNDFANLLNNENDKSIENINIKLKEFFNDKSSEENFSIIELSAEEKENDILITWKFSKYEIEILGSQEMPNFDSIVPPNGQPSQPNILTFKI